MHVGAFTRNPNSGVPASRRGTYQGVIDKIPYLQDLGVTAVELLPVFAFDDQDAPGGLNDWGYQPVSFFAPHPGYSSRPDPLGALDDFRDMVKALHRAGIEVILDVVYNHTTEAGAAGPTDLLPRVRQRYLLHPRRERAVVCRLQRVRQHAERQPVDCAAADSRQPPLLGDRDARGRLPLRSRLDPVPRRAGQADGDAAPAVGHRVGPGVRQRQADRGSLGRGRPLPGRALRRRQLDGMERQVSRRRAGVPEGRRGNGARTRAPADRQPRHATGTRTGRRNRASTSSPATMASR